MHELVNLAICVVCCVQLGRSVQFCPSPLITHHLTACRVLAAGGVPEGYEAFVPSKRPILMVAQIPDSITGATGASTAQSVYDFKFDRQTCKWVPWVDTIAPMSFPTGATFSELMVPTKDTAR